MQNQIGTIIRKLRLSKNMTQKDLCDHLCSIKQLSRIEQNTSSPTAYLLSALSEKLGDELLDFLPYSDDEMGFELKLTFDHLMQLYHLEEYQEVYKTIKSSLLLTHTTNPRGIQERDWLIGAVGHYIQTDVLINTDYFLDLLKKKYTITQLSDIFNFPLTQLDYRILNSLIVYLINAGNLEQSKTLLEQAIDHYESHYSIIEDTAYTRFIFNLANLLCRADPQASLAISEKGIQHGIQMGQLTFLAELYQISSRSAFLLGDIKKSDLYHKKYVVLASLGMPSE